MQRTSFWLVAAILFFGWNGTIGVTAGDAEDSTAFPKSPDTRWMSKTKFGLFMHYQYRILLGYCIRTNPQFPEPAQMTASQWNQFVDGFDVQKFAGQMAEARVGWVMFCLDDHYYAWPCAPNQAFSTYTVLLRAKNVPGAI